MQVSNPSISIVVVGGVRPQFIKIAALQEAIREFNQTSPTKINAKYINSGQHYDYELAGAIISELGVHFDFTLTHVDRKPIHMLGNMIVGIYEILDGLEVEPQWVVVLGDTTTTMAGALAAARKGYPVVHIEAGVRSGDLVAPEEIHRRVVSHISSVHFCASKSGVDNLKAENILNRVFWTGDLSYNFFMDYAQRQPCGLAPYPVGEYILATLHKSVNLDSDEILRNLLQTLNTYPREVLFVTHPRCRKRIIELGLHQMEGIKFMDSLPYGNMISAIKGCAFLVTDSDGLQREAHYLKKRCLVRRYKHGWSFLVSAGIHHLIGTNRESISLGLEWIEKVLASREYDYSDEFVREGACEYALNTLVGLST